MAVTDQPDAATVIGALALLFGAVAVASSGHRLLQAATRSERLGPVPVLVAWVVSVVAVITTSVAAVAVLALPGHGGLGELLAGLNYCWYELQQGVHRSWELLAGVLAGAALGAMATRQWTVARRQSRARSGRRERYRFLLAMAAAPVAPTVRGSRTPPVVWLDHPKPLAFSMSGGRGLIVVSHGLRRRLAPVQLAATLEHERAHLRGHHHLLLHLVDATAAAMPAVRLFAAAPAAVRELIELAADDVAVRRCGSGPVAEALSEVAVWIDSDGARRADPIAARRLNRLAVRTGTMPTPVRVLYCWTSGVLAAALPTVIGLALLWCVALAIG